MKPLKADEILDLTAYEKERERFRAHVIEHKHRRRVAVGDRLTFVFEDRDTVRFQIQEMVRAERTCPFHLSLSPRLGDSRRP